jgi:hypothetical protein
MSVCKPRLALLSASRGHTSKEVLWTSEPMLIGKTHWVAVIYYCNIQEITFSGYHYRDEKFEPCIPYTEWPTSEDHPKYNSNDGTNMGLPKSLKKLWEQNKQIVANCALISKAEAVEKIQKSETSLF